MTTSTLPFAFNRFPANLSDENFVNHFYAALLAREAEPESRSHHSRLLASGTTRGDLLRAFRLSAEFDRRDQQSHGASIALLLFDKEAELAAPLISYAIGEAGSSEDMLTIAESVVQSTEMALSPLEMTALFGPVVSWIDHVRNGVITGWVLHPQASEVTILIDDAIVATVPCDRHRPDLARAGLADPCKGFEYRIEPGRIQGVLSSVKVMADGHALSPSDRFVSQWLLERLDGLSSISNFRPFQSRAFKAR